MKDREKTRKTRFSKTLPNNQIITACRIELRVQEMTMNKKLIMIGLMLNVFGKDYGWNFRMILSFRMISSQTAILGLYNAPNDNYNLLSHILLIFKYYIYISREKQTLNIDILIANLIKVKGEANKHWYHQ